MATYEEIRTFVKDNGGGYVKDCHIAHVKEICGLAPKPSHNRLHKNERQVPCPESKINITKKALQHFKMLSDRQKLINKNYTKIKERDSI